jgi:hypothetical protein
VLGGWVCVIVWIDADRMAVVVVVWCWIRVVVIAAMRDVRVDIDTSAYAGTGQPMS